jgi:hypothetical protein
MRYFWSGSRRRVLLATLIAAIIAGPLHVARAADPPATVDQRSFD